MNKLDLWIPTLTLSENHAYGQRKYGRGRFLKPEAVEWIALTKEDIHRQVKHHVELGLIDSLPTLEDAVKGIRFEFHFYYPNLLRRDCHNQKLLYDVISDYLEIDDQYFIPGGDSQITIGKGEGIAVKITWGKEIRHLSPECKNGKRR